VQWRGNATFTEALTAQISQRVSTSIFSMARPQAPECLGHAAMISAGEFVQASGGWVNEPTHGVQFRASFLKATAPTTVDGIEKYLGSGMIRGIGRSMRRSSCAPSAEPCLTSSSKSNPVVAVHYNPTPTPHLADLNGWCFGIFFRIEAARQRAHELRSMPVYEISQLHVFIRFHCYRLPFYVGLLIR
jgi:hypothetical protein